MLRYEEYLAAAAQLAREQWTQFYMPLMLLGILLFTACLLLQAYMLWHSLPTGCCSTGLAGQHWKWVLPCGAVGLVVVHAAGLFSTSFILSEGQMVCFLVATFAVLLLHCTLAALMQHRPQLALVHAHAESMYSGNSSKQAKRLPLRLTAVAAETVNPASDRPAALRQQQQSKALGSTHEESAYLHSLSGRRFFGSSHASSGVGCNSKCTNAVAFAVGLLVCNALMGSMGLVVRTGHDAMHKAAAPQAHHLQTEPPPADLLNAADAARLTEKNVKVDFASLHWLSAGLLHTQGLLAPRMCVIIFPFLLMGSKMVKCNTASQPYSSLQASTEKLVWSAYLVLAVYWLLLQLHLENTSLGFLMHQIGAALPRTSPLRSTFGNGLQGVLPHLHVIDHVANLSFMMLLPRLIFLCSGSALLLLLVTRILGHKQSLTALRPRLSSQISHNTVLAALATPVLLVSGPENSAICALGLLECACARELLQLLSGCWSHAKPSDPKAAVTKLDSGRQSGWLGVAEGCMLSLFSMQLFFCTGHFCEFAGLQYAAGKAT